MKHRAYPLLRLVEWLGKNRVRLFFAVGKFVEVKEINLPVKTAVGAHIVDYGMGLDPGNGLEMSAFGLYEARGKWLRRRGKS